MAHSSWKLIVSPRLSPSQYSRPLVGFVKLNLDGALKGNLRDTGYGVPFQDSQNNIKILYAMDCGHDNIMKHNTLLWKKAYSSQKENDTRNWS